MSAETLPSGSACELPGTGWLTEPVSAVTSAAFLVAGAAIAARAWRRRRAGELDGRQARDQGVYALLVAAVGVGSVIQHGPDPAWSDTAHDAPLVAVIAYVGADALADLTRRRGSPWWWIVPTAAVTALTPVAPLVADVSQGVLAGAVIGVSLLRARRRPALVRRTAIGVGLLTVGSVIGTLSRAGWPLCVPDSLWQGHGAWHLLAATALWVIAPVIGERAGAGERGVRDAAPVSGQRAPAEPDPA